jgi:hypothetical protein
MVLLLTAGCRDAFNECLSGKGKIKTQRIGLYPFQNVKVRDNISLELLNGPYFEMEVTAGEHVIEGLGVEITNGTLNLRNNSTCPILKDPWDAIIIKLTTPDLDTLFIENHGEIKSIMAFKTDDLVLRISESPSRIKLEVESKFIRVENLTGTGDIAISGYSQTADCYHAGFGTIDFRSLICKEIYINTVSANHCYVRAGEEYLFAVVAGKGNIYYHSDPARLVLQQEGSGRLIKVY